MQQKKEMVVKSNQLIEASYRLTLVEQQLILYAICKAREEERGLDDGEPITISANDFAIMFNANQVMVYGQLKTAINTLLKRLILINDIYSKSGKNKVRKNSYPWLARGSYVDGEGIVQLRFNIDIVPYITRLESEFTSYRLEKIGNMTSAHAVRIYELLYQYIAIGRREIEIDWLKETLQIDGQYKAIKDLKKWVVDVAVTQINEHSDIKVSYEQRKTGRAVTHFIFTIKTKEKIAHKPTGKPSKTVGDRAYIDKHAKPGETYDQAFTRLIKQVG